MKLYRIQTSDKQRRSRWYRWFGVEALPVKFAQPRVQEVPGATVLAFDLDAGRLSNMAIAAFAHRLARRHKLTLTAARHLVDGYALPAANCTVVADETAAATTWQKRPFSFAETGAYL